ncbi:MAG TPA: GNAT family N-acetyltransferase [Chitinispirillaceae bacterium]|nr:GNAT family N-acetyltransferase [Chitinispirillaceae bacterium]
MCNQFCDNIIFDQITADEFISLRKAVGWEVPEKGFVAAGLKNTLFSVCIRRVDTIIGYGRVVGDGGFTIFIQDVMVLPENQRQGVGTKIMEIIMSTIKQTFGRHTYIGLMATKGREPFYKRFGFIERPNERFGAGMIQFL